MAYKKNKKAMAQRRKPKTNKELRALYLSKRRQNKEAQSQGELFESTIGDEL